MTISDIIVLARQGYKKKDIDELLKAVPETEKTKEEPKEEPKETQSEQDSKPDFETMYNNILEKYNNTLDTLKKMQLDNRKDQTGHNEKSDEDIALEHFNKIMR